MFALNKYSINRHKKSPSEWTSLMYYLIVYVLVHYLFIFGDALRNSNVCFECPIIFLPKAPVASFEILIMIVLNKWSGGNHNKSNSYKREKECVGVFHDSNKYSSVNIGESGLWQDGLPI